MIDRALDRISEIPLPSIALRILEVAKDEKARVQSLAGVIAGDHPFAVRLLAIASSICSLSQEVTTVPQAVSALGFDTIKSLALGLTLYPFGPLHKEKANQEGKALALRNLWEHSLGCALGARRIALQTNHSSPNEAFVVGMVHDVGELLFYQYLRKEFFEVLATAEEKGIPLIEAETQVLGTNHAIAGELWVRKGGFPLLVQHAIRYHHCPLVSLPESVDPRLQKTLAVLRIADLFCESHQIGSAGERGGLYQKAWSLLGLEEAACQELLKPIKQEVEATRELFSFGEINVTESVSPQSPEEPRRSQYVCNPSAGKPRGQVIRFPAKGRYRSKPNGNGPGKKLTILVVEDHGSLCEILSLYFTGCGYHVRTANNGETALEILATEEIHLMLLDLMLPRINGYQVLQKLQQKQGASLPYIIVVSAGASGEDKEKVLKLGANEYLPKPFHISSILERIEDIESRFHPSKD